MKKIAQMLFSESFGKFGDFGSYPQGTVGPSNAKAAEPSGVKISEVEEEEEEHVEAAEKVQEESKPAEIEEVEKNDEKEESAKRHQKQNKNLTKKNQENPSHLILKATAVVKMEKVKSSHKTHPLNTKPCFLLSLNQYLNQPSFYPCNMALEEPKHKLENQFYPFLQKSKGENRRKLEKAYLFVDVKKGEKL
ncbi:hypothetical protein GH714_035658 [Hevea brasiliensis]|uniref:Uncharacterized protein n=1 Tax=Hevea brasiliensis TaxID=3981 RepID=A0A6A6KKR6_HEVBR|nr:hypothetical protein GH714_035658 [Hevea brasiliensis]